MISPVRKKFFSDTTHDTSGKVAVNQSGERFLLYKGDVCLNKMYFNDFLADDVRVLKHNIIIGIIDEPKQGFTHYMFMISEDSGDLLFFEKGDFDYATYSGTMKDKDTWNQYGVMTFLCYRDNGKYAVNKYGENYKYPSHLLCKKYSTKNIFALESKDSYNTLQYTFVDEHLNDLRDKRYTATLLGDYTFFRTVSQPYFYGVMFNKKKKTLDIDIQFKLIDCLTDNEAYSYYICLDEKSGYFLYADVNDEFTMIDKDIMVYKHVFDNPNMLDLTNSIMFQYKDKKFNIFSCRIGKYLFDEKLDDVKFETVSPGGYVELYYTKRGSSINVYVFGEDDKEIELIASEVKAVYNSRTNVKYPFHVILTGDGLCVYNLHQRSFEVIDDATQLSDKMFGVIMEADNGKYINLYASTKGLVFGEATDIQSYANDMNGKGVGVKINGKVFYLDV